MNDGEKFLKALDDIISETAMDYPPKKGDDKFLLLLYGSVVQNWNIDMRDHGIDAQIANYKKHCNELDEALTKEKVEIALRTINKMGKGELMPHDDRPISEVLADAFLLSAMSQMDRFIIKYMEGLKKESERGTLAKEKDKSTQAFTLEDILKKDNLFIKGMDMRIVVDHFIKLIESRKRNKPPFLTPDQFDLFLRKGFLLEDGISRLTFSNIGKGDKSYIIKGFHKFYSDVRDHYNHRYADDYINLMVECFDNWTYEKIKYDFKPGRNKVEW